MRKLTTVLAVSSLLGVGFVGGFTTDLWRTGGALAPEQRLTRLQAAPIVLAQRLEMLARPRGASAQSGELTPVETYLSVRDTILTQYANPPSEAKAARAWPGKLQEMATKGMVAAVGDIYTEYWSADDFKRQMETTNGRFGGIGARLDIRDHKPLIVEPIPGSPAAAKGLLPGDLILTVDGKSALISKDQRLDDVIKRIKGEPGTAVTLTIERKGKTRPLSFHLVRAIVNSPVVDSWMQDESAKIGYIRLDQFTDEADVQFDRALAQLEKQGMKALIFDLRGNPGGLLNIAVDLASRFLPSGPVVWTKKGQDDMRYEPVNTDKHRSPLYKGKYPTVVLINGGSASASEIVSGAIQDGGAGYLLGTRSFGKGLVQTILPIGERGGAVKVTTQHYYTRNKHDINLKRDEDGSPVGGTGGIKPDIIVTESQKDVEAQRNILRQEPGNRRGAAKFSPQIQRAVTVLKDRLAGKPWPASQRNQPDKQAAAARAEEGDDDQDK